MTTDLLLDRGELAPDLLDQLLCVDHVGLPRAGGSRRAPFLDLGARDVSALSDQRVTLRGHDEVVAVEPTDLVGPPGHRDPPPTR